MNQAQPEIHSNIDSKKDHQIPFIKCILHTERLHVETSLGTNNSEFKSLKAVC